MVEDREDGELTTSGESAGGSEDEGATRDNTTKPTIPGIAELIRSDEEDSEQEEGASEQEERPHLELNHRTNHDGRLPEQGKTDAKLYRGKIRVGSKYDCKVPLTDAAKQILASAHPRAAPADLETIYKCCAASLAKTSKSQRQTAENAYTRVLGSKNWMFHPQPEDRAVILSRMVQAGSIKIASALQYMKSYGACLTFAGHDTVPPETETFKRMKAGLRKMIRDPIKDVVQETRKAYSLESLQLALGAFAEMRHNRLWTDIKTQRITTVLLLSFWGRFRIGEVIPATADNLLWQDTLLLLDIDFISDDDGAQYIRVWLRKEKMSYHDGGSMVEIPRLPPDMADICPHRALTRYIRMMTKDRKAAKSKPLSRYDPLFTTEDGSVLTQPKYKRAVEEAIALSLPEDKDLYDWIKSHSARSAIPTLSQEMAGFLDEKIVKGLGRWESSAYLKYLKSFEAALATRKVVEQQIVQLIAKKRKAMEEELAGAAGGRPGGRNGKGGKTKALDTNK